jgi:hypothetical protein
METKETIATAESTLATKKTTRNIPTKENDLLTLGKNVIAKWKTEAVITLVWAKPVDLDKFLKDFETAFDAKRDQGGNRTPISKQLAMLDKQVDDGIDYVKGYLEDKYSKKNAKAYYAKFGIEKVGNSYKLPKDRDQRKKALAQLVAAIASEGFGSKNYGTAYWTPIATQYNTLTKQASDTDSSITSNVGNKKLNKTQIVKVINSLIHVIKGNYPDTYSMVLRTWGIQKEKY